MRFFVKPVGHSGHFVLTMGELCQDNTLKEIPGCWQSVRFRSHDEALTLLFGTTDLQVLVLNIQRDNLPLVERISILEQLMVLRRSMNEYLLPEATPAPGQYMIAQRKGTCSASEVDEAFATLGF